MSRDLVTLIYSRKTGSMLRKAVLTAMADRANDDGTGIWLSKQRIADEIEASRQGVVNAIKSLLKDDLLIEIGERSCANGWTMEYAISVPLVCALPVRAQHVGDPPKYVGVQNTNTPPNPVEPTPKPGGGHPPTPLSQTVLNRPEPTAKAVNTGAKKKPGRVRGAARKSQVPANWAPSPKDYAFAASKGLTPEEINRESEKFVNDRRSKGVGYVDHSAGWRTWVGNCLTYGTVECARRKHAGARANDSDRFVEALHEAANRATDCPGGGEWEDRIPANRRLAGSGGAGAPEPFTIEASAHASNAEAGGRPSGPDGGDLSRDAKDGRSGGRGSLLDFDFSETTNRGRAVGF